MEFNLMIDIRQGGEEILYTLQPVSQLLTISSDFWFNNNCSLRSCNWKIVSFNFCSLSMAFFDVFCANCSNLCSLSLKWKKSKPLAPTPLILLLSSILDERRRERVGEVNNQFRSNRGIYL